MGFFQEHKVMLIAGFVGVVLGVLLNRWIRDMENRSYVEILVKEFNKLQDKAKVSALNMEDKKRMDRLDSEIYVMKFKCLA